MGAAEQGGALAQREVSGMCALIAPVKRLVSRLAQLLLQLVSQTCVFRVDQGVFRQRLQRLILKLEQIILLPQQALQKLVHDFTSYVEFLRNYI